MTDPMTRTPAPFRPTTVALVLALVLGAWALAGGTPRHLVAAEVDALEGGVRLAESLTATPPQPIGRALREGFQTFPGHPRVVTEGLSGPRREALVPPAPRLLVATGVMLAPVPESTPNGLRASLLAACAVVAAAVVLLARLPLSHAAGLTGLAACAPVVQDALTGFGYGALAFGAVTLVLWGLSPPTGAVTRSSGAARSGALAVGLALALGTHPFAAVLLLVPWLLPAERPLSNVSSAFPVALPWGRLLAPLVALGLLVALWPTLWSRTGAGLGLWLLEPGLAPGAPVEILGGHFDPAEGRGPQGFTALLQLLTALPLPLVGLAVHGLVVAPGSLRAPALVLAGLVLAGVLDGGFFGARLNLLPLLVPPLLVCAAASLARLAPVVARRVSGLAVALALALRLAGLGLEPSVPGSEALVALTGDVVDPPSPAADLARAVARDHLERPD